MDDTEARILPHSAIVGGLLVRVSEDPALRSRALETLRGRPDLLLGEPNGPWLPVAMEAEGPRTSRDLHDWILRVPGVEFVEVVAVHFESDFEPCPASRPAAA